MAPEVLTSRNYTAKADVFSFGVILWELLMYEIPDRSMQDVESGGLPPLLPKYLVCCHSFQGFFICF